MTDENKGIEEEITKTTVEPEVEVSNNSKEETTVEATETKEVKTEDTIKLELEHSQLKKELEELKKENEELKSNAIKVEPEVETEVKEDPNLKLEEIIKTYDAKFKELEENLTKLRTVNEFTNTNTSIQQNRKGSLTEMTVEDISGFRQII